MDLSSVPEDQRQQLQQLQQLFQEHQQNQQQQQQEEEQRQQQHQQQIQVYASSQAYDPTQAQPYDQSYYAYYQQYQDPNQAQQYPHYHHQQYQQQDQSQQQHNQHYEYHQANYPNAYQQPSNQQSIQQQYTYPESTPVSNPSESHPPQIAESGVAAAVSGQQQQNAYYPPQQEVAVGDQHNLGVSVPPGLNPAAAAAVAALSQLTQFAGTMEAAEKAMALVGIQARGCGGFGPITGQASGLGNFMGTGPMHHGPRPFHMQPAGQSAYSRGGGGGNFGNRPARSSGRDPPLHSRGRSRSRGGPKRFLSHPKASSVVNEEEAVELLTGEATVDNAQTPGSAAPPTKGGTPQTAWCDLCGVNCTSLEILEKHKNGKKHNKNLQNAIKPVSGEQKYVSGLNPEIVHQGEENKEKTLTENLTTVKKVGMERQKDMSRGKKRMMRGGKRLRTDGPRRPMEPRKQRKVVIPLLCHLCNVNCDTQEVFDRHVAGKKHISKLKRFEGHQAMYGPVGLQALYPPNPITQTLFNPQQAFYGPSPPSQGHHLAHNPNNQAPGPSSYFDGQMTTPIDHQQPGLVISGRNNQNGALESAVTG